MPLVVIASRHLTNSGYCYRLYRLRIIDMSISGIIKYLLSVEVQYATSIKTPQQ